MTGMAVSIPVPAMEPLRVSIWAAFNLFRPVVAVIVDEPQR